MPSVPELKRSPDTGIYSIHWTDPSPIRGRRGRSRRVSTGTTILAAAEIAFGKWLLKEKSQAAPGKSLTVGDLWTIYTERHVEANVADGGSRHVSAWKNLGPHFGSKTGPEIDESLVSDYRARRHSGKIGQVSTDSTVRLELLLLLACFNWCADPKRKPPIISKADVPSIELPEQADPNDRWLTTYEIKQLFLAAGDLRRRTDRLTRGERFLWLGLETASRKTAIFELQWARVDFETDVIDYNVPGRRRTRKKRAAVPISETLKPKLQQMYDERISDFVLDHGADINWTLNRIGELAGVEGVTPHVLRHTAATHMARRGVPLWIIAKILGNTVEMVERVYAKHCPDDLRDGINRISGQIPTGVFG